MLFFAIFFILSEEYLFNAKQTIKHLHVTLEALRIFKLNNYIEEEFSTDKYLSKK